MTDPEASPSAEQQAEEADELPKLTAEEWAYIKAVTDAQPKDGD